MPKCLASSVARPKSCKPLSVGSVTINTRSAPVIEAIAVLFHHYVSDHRLKDLLQIEGWQPALKRQDTIFIVADNVPEIEPVNVVPRETASGQHLNASLVFVIGFRLEVRLPIDRDLHGVLLQWAAAILTSYAVQKACRFGYGLLKWAPSL